MEPVFEHGQLRLYLLVVLADGPLSGYDIIRKLEDRFGGLYSPSAGTVYPRLGKLEEEGLVERSTEGRRSTFAITDAGRRELEDRPDDVTRLHERLDSAHRRRADAMREKVSSSAAALRAQLEDAARLAWSAATGHDDRTGAEHQPVEGATEHVRVGDGAGRDEPGTSGPTSDPDDGRQRASSAHGAGEAFAAFGSALFARPGRGGSDWSDLARWFSYAATQDDAGEPPPPGDARRDGGTQVPDPQQWAEILGILRDAASRINDVLTSDSRTRRHDDE